MKSELSQLELNTLKSIYESRVNELLKCLLSGTAWDAMEEIREDLNELSTVMYEKVQASGKYNAVNNSSGERERR